jgi:Flp pilus assembly protein TadD
VKRFCFVSLFAARLCSAANAAGAHYVGPETCALCHKEIAAKQKQTAMANTWQGRFAPWLPASFRASTTDNFVYEIKREGETLNNLVEFPAGMKLSLPVSIAMGGRRHGLGFLLPVKEIDGIPLARSALVQARYAWSPEREKLLLAPGCVSGKPQSLESALGLVLSPTFEARCLSCHGEPAHLGTGSHGGVQCESCHGPGSEHLAAIARGTPQQGMINPQRLSAQDSMAVCARCHVGLARFSDPSPDDLLVANQVRAIQSSECFLQSRPAFSCTLCHDAHNDSVARDTRAINACLGCHSGKTNSHAAICPINAASGCIGCHMPSVEMGPLHLVDHLIRVHPEQKIQPVNPGAGLSTQIAPISEYLRMIATKTAESAASARERIAKGESFYQVARETSVDPSADIGGYLGRKTLAQLSADLSAAAGRLAHGEVSPVVQSGARWVILQRLPRDFRWDAEQSQIQAEDLAARGDARSAIEKAQQALMIYPQFLRAIRFIGITFAQSGNAKKAAAVLATATRLYPQDAGAEFALASTLDLLDDKAAASAAYRRTISLDPDSPPAYANLGMIAYASADWPSAIATFRQGLQIDPLSAELNYDLSLALSRRGEITAAGKALALARRLDPALVESREAGR